MGVGRVEEKTIIHCYKRKFRSMCVPFAQAFLTLENRHGRPVIPPYTLLSEVGGSVEHNVKVETVQ